MRSLGLVLLSSTCLILAACSSNTTIDAEDGTGGASGGTAGAAGADSGGGGTGGGDMGGGDTGGGDTGGAAGAATGGAAGAPEGGTTTGGAPTGGVTGGAAGASATGGAVTGGVATGGAAGTPITGGAPTGGTATGGISDGGTTTGGTATGGTTTGGTTTGGTTTGGTGTGGTGGNTDTTVTGTVIDFWRRPLAGVPVEIGGVSAQTDANGDFTVTDVAPTYDVSLMIEFTSFGWPETFGWVYQGLTRRDPTLQVYRGLPERSATATSTFDNLAVADDRTLTLAFGGEDGSWYDDGITSSGRTDFPEWRGPLTTTASAHALQWQYDAADQPLSYTAYDSTLVVLSESSPADLTLDLTENAIPSGSVSTTVDNPDGLGADFWAFVRFDSGAHIPVADGNLTSAMFSVLVPTITGSSITVAAVAGDPYYGPFVAAHEDGVAAGNTADLALPDPATLLTPANGATGVTTGSQVSFLAGAAGDGAYVVAMINNDSDRGLYVVTAAETFTIPEVVNGAFQLPAASSIWWRVETHGSQTTVDEMTGPTGFMDSYSGTRDAPTGPNRASGEFAMTGERLFVTP